VIINSSSNKKVFKKSCDQVWMAGALVGHLFGSRLVEGDFTQLSVISWY